MNNLSTQSDSLPNPVTDEHVSTTDKCKNCSTPLSGPFCHQCGQPNKSIIRFFGSLIHELLEDIISLDSRAARTLVALLFKPGFLTKEYVSGRRFFYVPPLRLFLFTSLFCIFTIWILNKTSDNQGIQINDDEIVANEGFDQQQKQKILDSLAEKPLDQLTEEERIKARAKLDAVNKAMQFTAPQNVIEIPEELLTEQEKAERANITALEPTKPAGPEKPAKVTVESSNNEEQADASSSDAISDAEAPQSHDGLHISDGKVNANFPFLSEEDNRQLSERLTENIKDLKDPEERKDFISDLLELVPKLMLLLVPLFAVLMKICYPFAKRYYIEHLIHAFHGHAFLFLALLLAIIFELLDETLSVSSNWLVSLTGNLFGLLEILTLFWIPIYFLISLRKVYQQNWFLTTFKWFTLGILYSILFITAAVIVLILSVLFN